MPDNIQTLGLHPFSSSSDKTVAFLHSLLDTTVRVAHSVTLHSTTAVNDSRTVSLLRERSTGQHLLHLDVGSPLYYAALCGFYDLAEHLIMKHPEHVNASGGRIVAPLSAALRKGHFGGNGERTPLYTASVDGRVDIMHIRKNLPR
ncbi:hypothetical protein EDB85DRAFT_2295651 [Lactarius pseudohatsudake]|nr:hypothetical protein EDB85DRAFT_2295651 [Lactarius pseudohatsudake]